MTKKRRVVDARADSKGNIEAVLLEGNSRFTAVEKAVELADRGELENAHAVHPKGKTAHLRANPNSRTGDNLDSMAGDS